MVLRCLKEVAETWKWHRGRERRFTPLVLGIDIGTLV